MLEAVVVCCVPADSQVPQPISPSHDSKENVMRKGFRVEITCQIMSRIK